LMGMRAASAVTNKLAEYASTPIAAGSNASAVLGYTLAVTSPFLIGFVTGFGEMGVSVQGPQEPAGSDPGGAVNSSVAFWSDGFMSLEQQLSAIDSTLTSPAGSTHTTTPGSAPWLARARIRIHWIGENLSFIRHKIVYRVLNGQQIPFRRFPLVRVANSEVPCQLIWTCV